LGAGRLEPNRPNIRLQPKDLAQDSSDREIARQHAVLQELRTVLKQLTMP